MRCPAAKRNPSPDAVSDRRLARAANTARKRGGLVGGAVQGAAPYALLAEPQPVMGADADFNRRISRDEVVKAAKSRFALLDADRDALLRVEELPVTPVQGRRR